MKKTAQNISIKTQKYNAKDKRFLKLLLVGFFVLFSVLSFKFFVAPADAAGINNQINFQGKLVNSNGTNVADSTYSVVFSLYNVSSSGTNIWTETDSVTTTGGIFQVALGAVTAFPGNVDFNNSNLYLGIKVGTDSEMTPRIRFSAVPYAFNAAALDDVVATESATGFNMQGGTSSLSTIAFTTAGGALTFQPGVAEGLTLESNGANGLTLDTGGNSSISIGTGNATSVAFGKGSNNTSFTFNNGTSGFTVNGSGNITLSALNTTDGLVYTSGTNGILSQIAPSGGSQCLQSNSGNTALSWVSCNGIGTNFWQSVGNALSPSNITNDLLLGGTSTTSARFAFINNIGSGVPTASISANSGSNATYISGNGIVGTTNGESLTLGSASTGNLQFFSSANTLTSAGNLTLAGTTGINLSGSGADLNFSGTGATNTITTSGNDDFAIMPNGNGGVGINTTNPLASLDVRNNLGTTATASISGATSYAGLVVNNSGSGSIITASSSGQTEFTIANNGTVELNNANYGACGVLSTDVAGNVDCTSAGANQDLTSVYTITAPSGTNLHINFTGAANSAPASSSGTITFPANTKQLQVEIKGAGGGGGGVGGATSVIKAAGGGGEGGYANKYITSINSDYYVKVGGGGVAGAATGTAGGVGTQTCIGTNSTDACTSPIMNATGGLGGAGISAVGVAAGGVAGTGAGGDVNLSGQSGFNSSAIASADWSGAGGGIGGAPSLTASGNGTNGANGGGGSGGGDIPAAATTRTGGVGGNGYIVFYIYTNASSSSPASDNWYQYGDGVLAPLNLTSDVFIGGIATGSADFAFTGVDSTTPIASISAYTNGGDKNGLSLNSSTSTIQSLLNNTLTLGGNTTGAIAFQPGGVTTGSSLYLATNGSAGIGTTTPLATFDIRGNSATTAAASVSATTNFAAFEADNDGNGDIFTASKSGATKFTILNNGNVQMNNYSINGGLLYTSGTSGLVAQVAAGTSSECLLGGTTPTWGNCAIGTNEWQQISGAISPTTITDDMLLGGISTSSARFAFTNDVGAGTPTASISANSGANATFLTGAGVLGTTNAQSLTLGSASTGNLQFYNSSNFINSTGNLTLAGTTGINLTGNSADINFTGTGADTITTASGQAFALMPGGSAGVGINTSTPLASLDVRGNSGITPVASVAGTTSFASMVVNNSGSGDLFTASKSGATKFTVLNNGALQLNNYTANGGLLFTSGTGVVAQTAAGTSAQCLLGGATPIFGTCALGTNEWNQISGAISPTTITDDVLLGGTATTSARFAFTNDVGAGTPTASISANVNNAATYLTGTGILSTTNNQSLTLGSATTGNVMINPGGGIAELTAFANGTVGIGAVTSTLATLDVRADSGTLSVASVSGSTSFAEEVVDQSGSGDLFTASKSGATKFVIENNGNIGFAGTNNILSTLASAATSAVTWTLPNATGTLCLQTSASCGFSLGQNYFQMPNSGAISPFSTTADLLVGGTATTSAKFAILNMDSGTPTASASAGTAGGAYFTATGAIQTTADQSLTLGGNTTGNIILNPVAGNYVGVGTTSPLASLDVRATTALNGGTIAIASISGKTSFAGLVVNNSGSGDLLAASTSGLTKFVVKNNGSVFFGGDTISASASGSTNNGSPAVINALPDTGSLVPNSSFEANNSGGALPDGWIAAASSSATITTDSTTAANGDKSLKIVLTNTSTAVYSPCFPVTVLAGALSNYDFGWYYKVTAAPVSTVRANIDQYTSKANCSDNTSNTVSAVSGGTIATNASFQSTAPAAVALTAGTTWARVHFFIASGAAGAATVNLDGVKFFPGTITNGLDYAEDYPADPNDIPQPGQVVYLEVSGSGTVVAPSDHYMDPSVIGVVSTNPGQVLDDGSMTNPVPIALAGRVPVNVSTANGPIQVGDYLTSSTIPGVAVKATGAGPVIGTAMGDDTDTNTTDVTQVTMFVNNTYYGGTQSTTSGLTLLSDAQDPSVLLDMLQGTQDASSSAALSDITNGNVVDGLSLLLSAISGHISSLSASHTWSSATNSADFQNSQLTLNGLTVNGSATVSADLRVSGNGLVEGILHVVDTLFANNFIANGVSDFFGNVIFHSGVTFDNAPVFDKDTAGFAIIAKGDDHVDVNFSTAYDQTPIVNASITFNPLTPTPSETVDQMQQREEALESAALGANIRYIITNRTTKGFTILLEQPASEDISFSWVALAVNSPVIFQSNGQNLQLPTPTEDISPSPIDTIIPTGIPVSPILTPTGDDTPTPGPGG